MNSIVSVIVPVYNVERYIRKCVDSVINQTYNNLEIILVNDGSPDQSPEICNQYSLQDKRVQVIHKENGGLSDARNAGLEICTGEYIMFVDGDDYLESTLVEKVVEKIEEKQSDIVIWGYYADFVDSKETLISTTTYKGINGDYDKHNFNEIPLSNQLVGLLGYAWNKLYRSEIIYRQSHTFTKGLSLVEDIVFNGQILESCSSISFIEKPLVHYMQRPRETLGAKFYDNYFELKKMALEALKCVFLHWNREEGEINKIIEQMGFDALKNTIRSLTQADNYNNYEKRTYLEKLLDEQSVKKIVVNVNLKSIKDKFIKYFMKRKNVTVLLSFYTLVK